MKFIVLYTKHQIVAMIRGKVLPKIRYDHLVVIQSQNMPKQHIAANKKRNLALQEHQWLPVQRQSQQSLPVQQEEVHK